MIPDTQNQSNRFNPRTHKKAEQSVESDCTGVAQNTYLVTIAKSVAKSSLNDANERLIERFYLQSLARLLLAIERGLNDNKKHRTETCLRFRAPFKTNIEIWRSHERKSAAYKNLIVCARIWTCAVCAASITERRRVEIQHAIAASGLYPVLITYTLQHDKSDSLKTVCDAIVSSYRAYTRHRTYKAAKAEFWYSGDIKSHEVTYAKGGWHPHFHVLWLCERQLTPYEIKQLCTALSKHWRDTLRKNGRTASLQRGVDVKAGDAEIYSYLAKFGHEPLETSGDISHELTKSTTKKGRAGGRTPHQLLLDYGEGDENAGVLWREYARVMHGRHYLIWSNGLKERIGLNEVSDTLAAASIPADSELFVSLTIEQWRAVRYMDKRAELLNLARETDLETVTAFVNYLQEIYEKERKTMGILRVDLGRKNEKILAEIETVYEVIYAFDCRYVKCRLCGASRKFYQPDSYPAQCPGCGNKIKHASDTSDVITVTES